MKENKWNILYIKTVSGKNMSLTKQVKLIISFIMLIMSGQSFALGKTTIGIIMFDGVLTSDVTAPAEIFGIASRKAWFSDYEVKLINIAKKEEVTTEEGLTIKTDLTIYDDVKLDVILTPSSYSMTPLLNNKDLINYVKKQGSSASWIASNCSGAFILAEAGLLDGHKATTWFGGEKGLKKDYPKVDVQFDKNVVVDGNIITSNGSIVSFQAALVLLEKMTSRKLADEVAEAYQWSRVKNMLLY